MSRSSRLRPTGSDTSKDGRYKCRRDYRQSVLQTAAHPAFGHIQAQLTLIISGIRLRLEFLKPASRRDRVRWLDGKGIGVGDQGRILTPQLFGRVDIQLDEIPVWIRNVDALAHSVIQHHVHPNTFRFKRRASAR